MIVLDFVVDSNVKNDLIGRSEVRGSVVFSSATPSRLEVKKLVSNNLKVDESLVIVKSVNTVFGGGSANFFAFVYDDKDKLSLFEQKYMIKRNSVTEKKEEKKEDKKEDKKEESSSDESAPKAKDKKEENSSGEPSPKIEDKKEEVKEEKTVPEDSPSDEKKVEEVKDSDSSKGGDT